MCKLYCILLAAKVDIPEWQTAFKEHGQFVETLTRRVLYGLCVIGTYYCLAPPLMYFLMRYVFQQEREYKFGVHV